MKSSQYLRLCNIGVFHRVQTRPRYFTMVGKGASHTWKMVSLDELISIYSIQARFSTWHFENLGAPENTKRGSALALLPRRLWRCQNVKHRPCLSMVLFRRRGWSRQLRVCLHRHSVLRPMNGIVMVSRLLQWNRLCTRQCHCRFFRCRFLRVIQLLIAAETILIGFPRTFQNSLNKEFSHLTWSHVCSRESVFVGRHEMLKCHFECRQRNQRSVF